MCSCAVASIRRLSCAGRRPLSGPRHRARAHGAREPPACGPRAVHAHAVGRGAAVSCVLLSICYIYARRFSRGPRAVGAHAHLLVPYSLSDSDRITCGLDLPPLAPGSTHYPGLVAPRRTGGGKWVVSHVRGRRWVVSGEASSQQACFPTSGRRPSKEARCQHAAVLPPVDPPSLPTTHASRRAPRIPGSGSSSGLVQYSRTPRTPWR